MREHPSREPTDARALPRCADHPGSLVRRYRSHGPTGPGVYPQCLPGGGEHPHLLAWEPEPTDDDPLHEHAQLSPSELEILWDAAAGMTSGECALRHHKSVETVKSQRKSILLKLGARNIVQAVGMAVEEGLIHAIREPVD